MQRPAMIRHAAGCLIAAAVILLVTLLPFLPGPYDPLAGPLSFTARVFGFVGLVLVPFGGIWLARPRRGPAIAALASVGVVWAVMSLAAFAIAGFLLTAMVILWGGLLFARIRSYARTGEKAPALYLVSVPIAVFLLQQAIVPRAVAFSRDRAIRNAAPFLADIEAHRVERGAYPASLLSVWPDYKPGVIGIERYHYEPSGRGYNLIFEQVARDLPTREFVVYNPLDEQVVSSHAMDRVQYPPERLARTHGFFAVHETLHPHWKYFWFD